MKPILSLLAASALSLAVAPAGAAGNIEAGKKTAETACKACHGADGNSPTPLYPKLAGQHADYIVQALEAYQSGARTSALMAGFVANLSAQDRADLAAWFASQKGGVYTVGD